ncbi:MAG: hypothetical protein C4523_13945 [Myxococcales bacterium]|nr:MAG: hypothetical protein C4523_13945 [Myxococcales bacterium]
MSWLWLGFACGALIGAQGAFAKRLMADRHYMAVAWAAHAASAPVFALYLWVIDEPSPALRPIFAVYLFSGVGLLMIATTLYFKALQVGELSRDVPLLSLTPIFMLLTSRVMVNQTLTLAGAAAILVAVFGCVLLQKQPGRGLREMVAALWRERGSRLMLVVAFIWSITANFDKLCIDEVGPSYYPLFANLAFAVLYLPVLKLFGVRWREVVGFRAWPLALLGPLQAAAALTQMQAVAVAPHVAYVITLKRGGLLLFGLFAGAAFFGERRLGWRAVGAAWIVAGLGLLATLA